MGWVKVRPRQDGRAQYTAMYRDLRGQERSAGTFTSRRAANRAWQRAESDLTTGRVGDLKRGRQTLRHYVEKEWFPNHVIEAKTRENYTFPDVAGQDFDHPHRAQLGQDVAVEDVNG